MLSVYTYYIHAFIQTLHAYIQYVHANMQIFTRCVCTWRILSCTGLACATGASSLLLPSLLSGLNHWFGSIRDWMHCLRSVVAAVAWRTRAFLFAQKWHRGARWRASVLLVHGVLSPDTTWQATSYTRSSNRTYPSRLFALPPPPSLPLSRSLSFFLAKTVSGTLGGT